MEFDGALYYTSLVYGIQLEVVSYTLIGGELV
jgi:hypothetical protein